MDDGGAANAPLTDVMAEDPRWDAADLSMLAETAARATLAHLDLPAAGFEIAVLGADDARIATLNAEFRGKAQPTNVLSWPSEDRAPDTPGARPERPLAASDADPAHLGDIALAFETCNAEAEAIGKPLRAHVTHLVVHGTLHLLGYDHVTEADAVLMERLETEVLGKLGLPDPYKEVWGPAGSA